MAAKGSWIRIKATEAHLDATTVNAIITDALGRKAISVTQKPELRKAIGQELLEQVTPFVPEFTGKLRKSGRVTDDGRLYWTAVRPPYSNEGSYAFNYANITYDPDAYQWPEGTTYARPHTDDTHPRWMKKVTDDPSQWNAFVLSITPLIKEAFKDE